MSDVVIIGGGLGGLFTGALLAKEGIRVTVLEKNATIGGGLQSFRRFGETFDTGMHVVGGMEPGGNVWQICDYLGIARKARLRPVDKDCSDLLYFAEDRRTYRIAGGNDGFVRSLATYFPGERDGIEAYLRAVYAIADAIDLYNLRPATTTLQPLPATALLPADAFIARYVRDRRLRSVLAYINPFYGGRADTTPAYIHALIHVLYIKGTRRFEGGSAHFAHLLEEVITAAGGSVIAGDAVTHVATESDNDGNGRTRHVTHVTTKSGRTYHADHYISAIHPCALLDITDEHAFPRSYRDRLNAIPNAYSAFSLYIKMRPATFPYINHSEYFMTRYADVWHCGDADRPWPLGFLIMTPPETQQGPYSTKVLVTAPMTFDKVRRWEDTTVGKRGKDYERWKTEHARLLLAMIEELHPGFNDAVEAVNTSSPLTIRDFYGVKDGALSGYSKDYRNIAMSQLPVVTKVSNLLLTGQNNRLHGFCGVPLTAINTCEALLGRNYIIDKIRSHA